LSKINVSATVRETKNKTKITQMKSAKLYLGKNHVSVPVGEMCIKFNATQQGGEARRHGK